MTFKSYIDPGGYTFIRIAGVIAGCPDVTEYHSFINGRLQDGSRIFIISFKDAELLNNVGLSMLTCSQTQVISAGGRFVLCHTKAIEEILNLLGTKCAYELYGTEAEACKAVGAPLPEFVAS